MKIFPNGIDITDAELLCGLHITVDLEDWLRLTLLNKALRRRDALIKNWLPILDADPDILDLPANLADLAQLILDRPDYRTRVQRDADELQEDKDILVQRRGIASRFFLDPDAKAEFDAHTQHVLISMDKVRPPHNIARFNGDVGGRPRRDPSRATVKLFLGGIDIPDTARDCILAYVQNLDDWVLGALLGIINKGKKLMLRQYLPILFEDPDTPTIPANTDGRILMITARADYESLPAAVERNRREKQPALNHA